jgi:demethylmenaquinone methyltransferase/2-methoxy-6-polyprenyl-1,4-benzoquinol methylase
MRRDFLHGVFSSVPGRYDAVNRIVTLGLDQGWRRSAAREALRDGPAAILDLCTGTGDMAVMVARMSAPGATVVACDFVARMLEAARRKAIRHGVDGRLLFGQADAAALPFRDGSFDVVTIAFGFRNLTYKNQNREAHLAQILRVLGPGGRLVVVESSQPESALLRAGFRGFLAAFVGPVGRMVSGEGAAYRYLSSSVRNFPGAARIAEMLEDAGFEGVGYRRLLGGSAAIHWGSKAVTAGPR